MAARLAEQHSSWQCGACTLVNAPSARVCEACGQLRPSADDANNQWRQQQQQQQQQPAAAAVPARAAAPVPAAAAPASSGWAAAARPAPVAALRAPPAAAAVVAPPPPSADAFPALPVAAPRPSSSGGGAASSGAGTGGGGKKGKGKQALLLQEFTKATKVHPQVRPPHAGAGGRLRWPSLSRCCSLCSRRRRPPVTTPPPLRPTLQNVWRNPSLQGQWSKGGTLAQEERALLDAYGSRRRKRSDADGAL